MAEICVYSDTKTGLLPNLPAGGLLLRLPILHVPLGQGNMPKPHGLDKKDKAVLLPAEHHRAAAFLLFHTIILTFRNLSRCGC